AAGRYSDNAFHRSPGDDAVTDTDRRILRSCIKHVAVVRTDGRVRGVLRIIDSCRLVLLKGKVAASDSAVAGVNAKDSARKRPQPLSRPNGNGGSTMQFDGVHLREV